LGGFRSLAESGTRRMRWFGRLGGEAGNQGGVGERGSFDKTKMRDWTDEGEMTVFEATLSVLVCSPF